MQIAPDYKPLVSIIIPVKNGEATLGQCLRSIRRSYYKNIEVVVVDDHSTDRTAEIAGSYNCRLIAAEEGAGANAARNLGAGKANGEIFVFIDSDVLVRRETILGIVERLEEKEEVEMGKRLTRQNVKIELDMEIEVEHLREYNLFSFIRNEFKRSAG